MFEALRSLRDAVAPESGNLGVSSAAAAVGAPPQGDAAGSAAPTSSSSSTSAEPDLDELWNLYKNGDAEVVGRIRDACGGNGSALPQRREDFVRLHAKMEMEKDTELVTRLASTVLDKSDQINAQLDAVPGMNRTRDQQLQIIEGLISLNQKAAADLEDAYRTAVARRASCRRYVQANTCAALGIHEDDGVDEAQN